MEVRDSRRPLPPALKPLLAECYPLYDIIARQALRPVDVDAPEGPVQRPLSAAVLPVSSAAAVVGGGDALTGGPVPAAAASCDGAVGHSAALGAEAEAAVASAGAPAGSMGLARPGEKGGTHCYVQDPRNDDVLIGIRDGVTGRFSLVRRRGLGCRAPYQHTHCYYS